MISFLHWDLPELLWATPCNLNSLWTPELTLREHDSRSHYAMAKALSSQEIPAPTDVQSPRETPKLQRTSTKWCSFSPGCCLSRDPFDHCSVGAVCQSQSLALKRVGSGFPRRGVYICGFRSHEQPDLTPCEPSYCRWTQTISHHLTTPEG